jgi:hypothetical protein
MAFNATIFTKIATIQSSVAISCTEYCQTRKKNVEIDGRASFTP